MTEHELACPDCGERMELARDHFGVRYLCVRRCGGTHGCHPDGSPMGEPADARTRKARSVAHAHFDRLWQERHMTRSQAYAWMQRALGVTADGAHIGRLTAEECRALVSRLEKDFPDVFPFAGD